MRIVAGDRWAWNSLIREDLTALWEPYACAPGKAVACHLPYCLENLIGLPDKKEHSYTATLTTSPSIAHMCWIVISTPSNKYPRTHPFLRTAFPPQTQSPQPPYRLNPPILERGGHHRYNGRLQSNHGSNDARRKPLPRRLSRACGSTRPHRKRSDLASLFEVNISTCRPLSTPRPQLRPNRRFY